jgi:hydroxypyruvate isomerase
VAYVVVQAVHVEVGGQVRFSLNVSTLFAELPLLERFDAAAAAGFAAVESWWPDGVDLDAFVEAVRATGTELALLNFYGGNVAAGDRGVLSNLERAGEFRDNAPIALEVASTLGCRRLHALVGKEQPGQAREDQVRLAIDNVRWVADLAAAQGATIMIEPLNRFDSGQYLIQRVSDAIAFIEEVGRDNVALQFDTYHVQRTEGDLGARIAAAGRLIGHVQIADAPGRGYPGSGRIDFAEAFEALAGTGYEGFVGLEYFAPNGTDDSLAWLPRGFRGADQRVADLASWLRGV